jgi:hypothetical protein
MDPGNIPALAGAPLFWQRPQASARVRAMQRPAALRASSAVRLPGQLGRAYPSIRAGREWLESGRDRSATTAAVKVRGSHVQTLAVSRVTDYPQSDD